MWVKLTEHLIVDPEEVCAVKDHIGPDDMDRIRNTTITLKTSGAVIVTDELTALEILHKLSISWVEKG